MRIKVKKVISLVLVAVFAVTLTTGCSFRESVEQIMGKDKKEIDYDEKIDDETAETGLKAKDLESGKYYVLHDDLYYPLYCDEVSYDSDDVSDDLNQADLTRKAFISIDNDKNIPTLFLDNDDELVYYNEDTLLDSITWERMRDEGFTIGAFGFEYLTSGKPYLPLSNADKPTDVLVSFSSISAQILGFTKEADVLFDTVGKTNLSEKNAMTDGLLSGLEPNVSYDVDLYVGTQYHSVTVKADTHAFANFEVYRSVEYSPMQVKNQFSIEIPDYLVTGYYFINDGLFRLVKDSDSYVLTDKDSFNEPLLEVEHSDVRDEDTLPSVYSECESLNHYETKTKGALGYKDDSITSTDTENDTENTETDEQAIAAAETHYYKVSPNETAGQLTITTDETTGRIELFNSKNKKTEVTYDSDSKRYSAELTEKEADDSYILVINGLYQKFEVGIPDTWEVENIEETQVDKNILNDVKDSEKRRRS